MFVSEEPWRASEMRFSQDKTCDTVPERYPAQEIDFAMASFGGSVADWCDQGFSICEGYLIEAQNLYLKGNFDGFVNMAEAQSDDELEAETLLHINALLSGHVFCRQAGEVTRIETKSSDGGLDWNAVAQLYRAMETTKGDMRMPRLDRDFERKLRAIMVLS
jgi:hypothetical protein